MKRPNNTHSYIARDPKTGHVFGIISDIADEKAWVAKEVAAWIKEGAEIERLPHADACELFGTNQLEPNPKQGELFA